MEQSNNQCDGAQNTCGNNGNLQRRNGLKAVETSAKTKPAKALLDRWRSEFLLFCSFPPGRGLLLCLSEVRGSRAAAAASLPEEVLTS